MKKRFLTSVSSPAAVNAVRISRKSDTNSSAEVTEVIFSRKYAWSRFSAGSRAMTACCAAIVRFSTRHPA